mgnify:CR=1 FL=1
MNDVASVNEITKVLRENYSLGELEDRFDTTTEELLELENYVESNYSKILHLLKEDLFFLDRY